MCLDRSGSEEDKGGNSKRGREKKGCKRRGARIRHLRMAGGDRWGEKRHRGGEHLRLVAAAQKVPRKGKIAGGTGERKKGVRARCVHCERSTRSEGSHLHKSGLKREGLTSLENRSRRRVRLLSVNVRHATVKS